MLQRLSKKRFTVSPAVASAVVQTSAENQVGGQAGLARLLVLGIHVLAGVSQRLDRRVEIDPVAGYVQVPCIERCAFGAVKAWTAVMIATNEIASRHRVDLDTTIKTLADTGKDMNAKYKETSEAGLAANLVLC